MLTTETLQHCHAGRNKKAWGVMWDSRADRPARAGPRTRTQLRPSEADRAEGLAQALAGINMTPRRLRWLLDREIPIHPDGGQRQDRPPNRAIAGGLEIAGETGRNYQRTRPARWTGQTLTESAALFPGLLGSRIGSAWGWELFFSICEGAIDGFKTSAGWPHRDSVGTF